MSQIYDKPIFEALYETDEGLKFIDPTDTNFKQIIDTQSSLGKFKIAFKFQIVSNAVIYAIFDNTVVNYDYFIELTDYPLATLYNYLMLGLLSIGTLKLNQDIITDCKHYIDKSNSEIILHYTKPRNYEGNIAWRSITWDLFATFITPVSKMEKIQQTKFILKPLNENIKNSLLHKRREKFMI